MVVRANEFPKLQTVKNLDRSPCKKRRFGTRFDSQHLKESQTLAKTPWESFYHVFSSFWENFIWKMSPLVLGKIFGVFLYTLTGDGTYPVEDWEYLQFPMQMQLSEKRKTFSELFLLFLESTNFKHLEKNMIIIPNVFPKIQTVINFDRPPSKKPRSGTRFERQHVKVSQILEKSPWEHFYHVFSSFWGTVIWKMSPLVWGKILSEFVNT